MTLTRSQLGETPRKTEHPGYAETPSRRSSRRSVAPTHYLDTITDSKTPTTARRSRSRGAQATSTDVDGAKTPSRVSGRRKSTARSISRARSNAKNAPNDVSDDEDDQDIKEAFKSARHDSEERNDAGLRKRNSPSPTPAPRSAIDGGTKRNLPSSTKLGHRIDTPGEYEFGGPIFVSLMMLGFPLLMWYMWIGATFYNGKLPWPQRSSRAGGYIDETWANFAETLFGYVYYGAFPSLRAWIIYGGFFMFEVLCYLFLPGIYAKGKPLEWDGGRRLDYYCSGVWSFYATILVAIGLHWTGAFRLDSIINEFGSIMSVAIITGFGASIIAYVSAISRKATHRMTGNYIYDFFMGAELNPRMFNGWLDFKMFFEVRIPWYMLFLVTLGAAARQWEIYGRVSPEMAFLLMAHFLYANACSKGEELIVTSWDMYYEKLGFMLIFWNLAGVPLSYCHCTIYLANHDPSLYAWSTPARIALFTSYLFVYWIWDTCNSQKNRFRQQERGTLLIRKTFPQLPWQTIARPKTIKTTTGDSILVDGWYAYARKIHYTCDLYFAITWALVTGFESPFPWFYPIFFAVMILHRAIRDQQKCRRRYGKAWDEYERRVPYLFIPYVF